MTNILIFNLLTEEVGAEAYTGISQGGGGWGLKLFTSIAAWRAVLPLITLQISGLAPACSKHLKIMNNYYKN